MVALKPIVELKRKRDALKVQQQELVEILKTKHYDAYKWFQENNIDLFDLKVYSASLAAAVVVAMSVSQGPVETPKLTLPVHVVTVTELQGLSEEQKADLVWKRYGHVIERNSGKYDLDPGLIFATIMLESGGNTNAIRHEPQIGDASYGLGQILYGTARGIGFDGSAQDLFDPEVNIELIARYHKRNQEVYGGSLTPQELTIAYNSGSPYSAPHPGHITKFNKWFSKVANYIG